jgi:hypothetical protein
VKQVITLLILSFLFGCTSNQIKYEVFKPDKNFHEYSRQYSPDSSMILLDYGINHGAFGIAPAGRAVLKLSDTLKNLRQFSIYDNFSFGKWIDNKHIQASFDIYPFLREGKSLDLKDTIINNIIIKFKPFDYIKPESRLVIEHKEISPNGQYELVAYRYPDKHNLNFIHISIIPKAGQIPKYGNYFIADSESDYILKGTWNTDNTLIFYTKTFDSEFIPSLLVVNRPNIDYKLVIDDKGFDGKYLWTE